MVKKTTKKMSKKTQKRPTGLKSWFVAPAPREPSTLNDVKNAVLIVSLTINLAVFITWLILKLTNVYDSQIYHFLFNR